MYKNLACFYMKLSTFAIVQWNFKFNFCHLQYVIHALTVNTENESTDEENQNEDEDEGNDYDAYVINGKTKGN